MPGRRGPILPQRVRRGGTLSPRLGSALLDRENLASPRARGPRGMSADSPGPFPATALISGPFLATPTRPTSEEASGQTAEMTPSAHGASEEWVEVQVPGQSSQPVGTPHAPTRLAEPDPGSQVEQIRRKQHAPYRLNADLLEIAIMAEARGMAVDLDVDVDLDAVDNPLTERRSDPGPGSPAKSLPPLVSHLAALFAQPNQQVRYDSSPSSSHASSPTSSRAPSPTSSRAPSPSPTRVLSPRSEGLVSPAEASAPEWSTLCASVDRYIAGPKPQRAVAPTKRKTNRSKKKSPSTLARDKVRSDWRRSLGEKNAAAQDMKRNGFVRRRMTHAALLTLARTQPVHLDVDLDFDLSDKDKATNRTFPVASSGFVGARVAHTAEEMQEHDLEYFMSRGFQYIEWDGINPLVFLDRRDRSILTLQGKPRRLRPWMQNHDEALRLMRVLSENYVFPAKNLNGRRGPHRVATVGSSFGGGQTEVRNIAQGVNKDLMDEFRRQEAIVRIANFMASGFKLFQGDMYDHYEDVMTQLRRADPELQWNFDKNVWAAATFNLGPQTVTRVHLDHMNYAPGMCGVMSLGDFNPKLGGHLVLWDLKLVIEFPPGSVVLIPSAILRHSNTSVAPGETRMSFTQFSAGGLFRWVECGMQSQKDFFASGGRYTKTGSERWLEGIRRFSTWSSLVARLRAKSR